MYFVQAQKDESGESKKVANRRVLSWTRVPDWWVCKDHIQHPFKQHVTDEEKGPEAPVKAPRKSGRKQTEAGRQA